MANLTKAFYGTLSAAEDDVIVFNLTSPTSGNLIAAPESINYDEMSGMIVALQRGLDTLFMLTMTLFIFLMQAGFCFMEAGVVRSKNTTHILLKSMLDAFIGGLAYWVFGYAIAWGEGNSVVGWTYFASYNVQRSSYLVWLFQCMFANTASTIVSGAVAERLDFGAYLVYSFFLTGFVYPPVSRWAWGPSGWLKKLGFMDFGGSAVVHMLGGCCALIGSVMVGPRLGRFDNGKTTFIKGHSVPLTCLGTFFLLIGFVSFNSASGGSLSKPGDIEVVSAASANTFLAGCGGALSAVILVRTIKPYRTYEKKRAWSFMSMANGAVVGMVASCAGCNNLQPWAAFLTGVTAAPVFLSLRWLLPKLKVDDPLDAFPVHFGGGFWGTFTTPLLSNDGIFLKGDKNSAMVFVYNLVGIVTIISWGSVCCLCLFGLLRYFKKLRIDPEAELRGLDLIEHGEPAYPFEAWLEEQYGTGNVSAHRREDALFSLDAAISARERSDTSTRTKVRKELVPATSIATQYFCLANPAFSACASARNANISEATCSHLYKKPPKKRANLQNSFDFPSASQVPLTSFY